MAKQYLHDILCDVLGDSFEDGTSHCYYEPPANIKMKYPCIVYEYNNSQNVYADNKIYKKARNYTVTIIDEDPDSKIRDRMDGIDYCTSVRSFVNDGLHHYVYSLYFGGERIKEE